LKLEDTNLNERSSRAWNEIYENMNEFYYKENLLDELDKITQVDLKEFIKLIFISQPRKLSVQLFGNQNDLKLNTENISEENYGILNEKIKALVKNDTNFLKLN
jgi:secreted Zn-dependent insulinase-like peptidase